MSPEIAFKADELIRMLGMLGAAQEAAADTGVLAELTSRATQLQRELSESLA